MWQPQFSAGGPGSVILDDSDGIFFWNGNEVFGRSSGSKNTVRSMKTGMYLADHSITFENGMGVKFRWLAKIFAFFGAGVGLFGIGTFTQVNGISSAVRNFLIRTWRIQ